MDKWIKNNTAAKLIALAVSMLLWVMVHIENGVPAPPTTSFDTKTVQVNIQTFGFDDTAYALTGISADQVSLRVKGRRTDITTIFADEYKVKLDLSGIKSPGTQTLPLTHSLPNGVELVSMDPSVVTVTVEERQSETVPAAVGTSGELAEGYRLSGPIEVNPKNVQVTMPESELARLSQVKGTVELDGAKESFEENRVKLTAYDQEGNEMTDAVINPPAIAVQVPVEAGFVKVPLEVQYTGSLPEGLVLSEADPRITEVTLYGEPEQIESIKSYNGALIDLSELTEAGTTVLSADLTPPPGFERIEPGSMEVEMTVVAVSERMMDDIPISITNVPSGLKAVMVEPGRSFLSMTLKGAPARLDELQVQDIILSADASGLDAGIHEIPLEVTLPRFVSRVNNSRIVITVELREPAEPATGEPSEPPGSPGSSDNDGREPVPEPEEEPDGDRSGEKDPMREEDDRAGSQPGSGTGPGEEEPAPEPGNEPGNPERDPADDPENEASTETTDTRAE
ncbi:hypothetical protein JJQ72_19555 [Paenibacillus sp. F411]|uniref:CdaR family protein n=1 Tax=Paenibacillus sp. F411 TaxID=2820239 RepID=UPI001AAE2CA6|nr:CdaR family protein [Paenibacillus sp. F411]MBO2946177.1 hypothetical protein [Paenibacillus sp. F411]